MANSHGGQCDDIGSHASRLFLRSTVFCPLRGLHRVGGRVKEEVATGQQPLYLAFDFGGTKIDIALATQGPHIIDRKTLETRAELGAVQAVERALTTGRELVQTHGEQALSAVGVSTMGYTREDGVDLAPNVPGWEVLRLPDAFRREFPHVPVALDIDV